MEAAEVSSDADFIDQIRSDVDADSSHDKT